MMKWNQKILPCKRKHSIVVFLFSPYCKEKRLRGRFDKDFVEYLPAFKLRICEALKYWPQMMIKKNWLDIFSF